VGGNGTIFKVLSDGSFSTLYSFSAASGQTSTGLPTNSDGATPRAALTLSEGTLYGTTSAGGSWGSGTVFKLKADGTSFEVLHHFSGVATPLNNPTNNDGSQPLATLTLLGTKLYGTTSVGGPWGAGTVFSVNTDGSGFTTLHGFTGGSDGSGPLAGLILSDNTLYGTAIGGGSFGVGTVFSITLPPPRLTITPAHASIILAWPTNAISFTLQSTTNLGSPVWTTDSPAPHRRQRPEHCDQSYFARSCFPVEPVTKSPAHDDA